jgi:hypothetical protein
MKRLFLLLLLIFGTTVWAQPYRHHGYWARHESGWGWVAPVIVGGAIGYELARPPQPIIVQQTPPPVVYQQQNCSPWTQLQNPDGTVTTTRTCYGLQ